MLVSSNQTAAMHCNSTVHVGQTQEGQLAALTDCGPVRLSRALVLLCSQGCMERSGFSGGFPAVLSCDDKPLLQEGMSKARAVEEQHPSPKQRHEGHFEAGPGDTTAGACWCLELHALLSKIRSDLSNFAAFCSDPSRLLSSARDRDSGSRAQQAMGVGRPWQLPEAFARPSRDNNCMHVLQVNCGPVKTSRHAQLRHQLRLALAFHADLCCQVLIPLPVFSFCHLFCLLGKLRSCAGVQGMAGCTASVHAKAPEQQCTPL